MVCRWAFAVYEKNNCFNFSLCMLFNFNCVFKKEEFDLNQEIRDSVEAYAIGYTTLAYDATFSSITCFIEETEKENRFAVSGKITLRDKYGDTYTGKYDAIAVFDPSTKKIDVGSFELDTPRKD